MIWDEKILGIIVTLLGMLVHLVRSASKFGALELKVDTMWDFQMRRAASEVVSANLGSINSPLTIFPQDFLDPIKLDLIKMWKKKWYKLSTHDVLIDIERMFGQTILKLICIPGGLSHGACLLVAYTVASGHNQIEI